MKVQKLNEEHYLESVHLSEYAFQYKVAEGELAKSIEGLKKHELYGVLNENQTLMAKLHMIPFHISFGHHKIPMGGIAGVATYPEYRRHGFVKELFQHVLEEMKHSGFIVSMLHPFFVKFYRKFGYEVFSNRLWITLKKSDLVRQDEVSGHIKRFLNPKEQLEPLNYIYEQYSEAFVGMLVREPDRWKDAVLRDFTAAVYYDENHKPTGYMLYKIKDSQMVVEEFFPLNAKARTGLWNFICQHDSMVNELKMVTYEREPLFYTLPEPRIESHLVPFAMARIVDAEAFLKIYPFETQELPDFYLELTDEWAPWNQQTFLVQNGKVKPHHEARPDGVPGVQLNINALTAILFGYKRPVELSQIGHITGTRDAIESFERLVGHKQPFLADYF